MSGTLNAVERQSDPDLDSDGVQWSTSGEKDGWLSGARLILPVDGLKVGAPLVVEYRLVNVSKESKTIRCLSNSGMQFASLATGNRIGGAYLDRQREPTMLTLQPGDVFVDREHLVSIDTTGLQPGEYQVSLGSAFCYPDEQNRNDVPHHGDIAVTLLGKSKVNYRQLAKSEIQWGTPVAGLQFGAQLVNHQTAYLNRELVEADLFIANVTDQPVDCSVLLPHSGDGWQFNVQDNAGSSTMFKRRAPIDTLSTETSIKMKLAPGEVAPITGDGIRVSLLPDTTIEPTLTTLPRARFQIVGSEDEAKQDHRDHTVNGKLVSQGGDYSATFQITVKRSDIPALRLDLATPALPFVVDAEKLSTTGRQPMEVELQPEIPPQPKTLDKAAQEMNSQKIYTVEQLLANGMELHDKQLPLTVRFKVVSVRRKGVGHPDGKETQHWFLSSEEYKDRLDPKAFEVQVSKDAEKALERSGVTDIPAHFNGKELTIEGKVSTSGLRLPGRDTIWFYSITLDSLDQLVMPVGEVELKQQPMQKSISDPVPGLAEKVTVAKGVTDDRKTGQSYKISLLVLASDDLKPVSGATVQVTLIGDDGGDGGFADFKTNEDGIALVDKVLWPGRYQINVRAPKDSRYRDTEFFKDEARLVVHDDGRYSPREFRLNVDETKLRK